MEESDSNQYFYNDYFANEVGAFGITRADDLLFVEDIAIVKQTVSIVTVSFDDLAVADYFENQVDLGRKRPEYYNHIWSYDFVTERLETGKKVKMLVVIDEYTRECLALDVAKHFKGQDVVEVLRYLFAVRGCPDYIRSDNGPEFVSKTVQKWLEIADVKTLYVAPGSPWENGYVESFNSRLRDEFLNRELFLHIDELRYVADRWRMDYNHYRPHSSLDYMSPAAFASKCLEQGSATLRLPQDKENTCDVLS